MKKKRVLFLGEASYLNTGYAKYTREILNRLHDSGKYVVAEMSTYGRPDDSRRKQIPWKNYPVMPPNDEKYLKLYKSAPHVQFGSMVFDFVCLDFKPDIVCTIRDFWMDSFVHFSPYRHVYSWAWMPTVDASPQNWEWLDVYCNCDFILTYSKFAAGVLKQQCGDNIRVSGVASPAASEFYKPLVKEDVRDKYGIKQDAVIYGTVMRNQRRKLFPTLLYAFRKFLDNIDNKEDVYLYLHTSFPDAGWNLVELIVENGLSNRVIMTYVCEKCNHVSPSYFMDGRAVCPTCGEYSFVPCNVNVGVSEETLCEIYNIMDLYIQCANSEGFGLPQIEALACGTPVMTIDYSAMADIASLMAKYDTIFAINNLAFYKELETGCCRAVPNPDIIGLNMSDIYNRYMTDKDEYNRLRQWCLDQYKDHYSWDMAAEKWMKVIDACKYADWNKPPRLLQHSPMPEFQSINQFLWYIRENMVTDELQFSYILRAIHSDLMRGVTRVGFDGYLHSEYNTEPSKHSRISPSDVFKQFLMKVRKHNNLEMLRIRNDLVINGDNIYELLQ